MKESDVDSIDAFVTEVRSRSQADQQAFLAIQNELRRIARSKMRRERADHTLQPTALINEAFLKVFKGMLPPNFWTDQTLATRYMTRAMGQILKDHADAYASAKRGGSLKHRVPLDQDQARQMDDESPRMRISPELLVNSANVEEVLGVRKALAMLQQTSPRQAQVVELLFYGGLTQQEAGAVLGVSEELVKLEWRKARSFLKIQMRMS